MFILNVYFDRALLSLIGDSTPAVACRRLLYDRYISPPSMRLRPRNGYLTPVYHFESFSTRPNGSKGTDLMGQVL